MRETEAVVVDRLNDGLRRAELLKPGSGFLEFKGGATQDGAFARGEAGVHLTDAATAFGFGEVRKSFDARPPDWMVGAVLRVSF